MIINKTPHEVTIVDKVGDTILKIPEGSRHSITRLKSTTTPVGRIDGVPISITIFGDVMCLPDFKEGVYYIVSQLVKAALSERKDLLVPAEMYRNASGRIIGCRSLGV